MGSKTFILLGLFLATVVLISSEVAARELGETTPEKNTVAATTDGHGGGGHGGGGGGGGQGSHGGCRHGWCGRHCCNQAGEAVEAELVADTETTTSEGNSVAYQGGGGGGYHQGGGGGYHQGGGGGYNQGGGGYNQGGCRHGWCGRHCCNQANDAADAEENSVADSKYRGGGGGNQGGGYNQGGGGGGYNQGGGGGWNQGGGGGYHGGGCRYGWCGRHCCNVAETQN